MSYSGTPAGLPLGPIPEYAAYRSEAHEPRACDRCGSVYQGPAVYCSFRCASLDALSEHDAELAQGRCPDCKSREFHPGPRGGAAQNWECAGCGQRFNITIWQGAFVWAQRI